jgi:hypothetical protein
MMLRRTLEGASKCALRDLRREEWRPARGPFVSFLSCANSSRNHPCSVALVTHVLELTLAILMEFCREDWR